MIINSSTHDLTLSDWGPYSKKYAGISHVANKEDGLRFDLSVFPGQYRRRTDLPNCMFEGNYYIKEASSDLSYFSTSHQIEWKDQLYTNVAYARYDKNCYVIHAHCVNNTHDMQNLVLHMMGSIQYPSINAKYDEVFLGTISYNLPENGVVLHAINFDTFEHKYVRPTDSLVQDGLRRGEVRGDGFYRGSGVELGDFDGDIIHYTLPDYACKNPTMSVRVKNSENTEVILHFNGKIKGEIVVPPCTQLSLMSGANVIANTQNEFTVYSTGGKAVLDSFLVYDANDANKVSVENLGVAHRPIAWEHGSDIPMDYIKNKSLNLEKTAEDILPIEDNILVLKYRDSEYYYGIGWDYTDFDVRYILNDELDTYLKVMAHDHVNKVLKYNDGNDGTFANVFLRPIPIEPNETKDVYGVVACGKSKEEVEEKLRCILKNKGCLPIVTEKRHAEVNKSLPTSYGEIYKFSQDIMTATTLTNVVYPVYTKRSYIKHNTPGKWWDSLYTWDSGFTGLGLMACQVDRAVDCLNAYLTEVGDEENAFIHHGTPIPVQFYLFQEIYNLTQSKELAEGCYSRLRQYYLFLVGKLGSSDTTKTGSGLVNTFSYFYNSGGWDDYPPQVYVHKNKLSQTVCPAANTSHMIRCAKILKQVAMILPEYSSDIEEYNSDIEKLSNALQKYSWDEKSGYFGYVCNDDKNGKTEILRHSSGENFNRGLDGMTPIIAGEVTDVQLEVIEKNLMDEERHFSKIGLSTVDKSAPYYRMDGYWNGAVWMPHQWFFSKALLDYGFTDDAYRVAKTALETWENEVSESHNCFEHFIIASGRGAGWHHFSGLSTPVLLWNQTYFKKGTVTCGHGGMVLSREYDENKLSTSIRFIDARKKTSIVLVMPECKDYTVTVNGKETEFFVRFSGVIELTIEVKDNETVDIVCITK